MNVYKPEVGADGIYYVEISYYPESRSVSILPFATYEEAIEFYNKHEDETMRVP